jgi:hypothetical protein
MRKSISIGGTDYPVDLPFGLGVLEDAGDAIDEVNKVQIEMNAQLTGDAQTVPTRMVARLLGALVSALHPAIHAAGSKVTLETLRKNVTMGDVGALTEAMTDALGRSGLQSAGEPTAPSAPRGSRSRSRRSSRT